MESASAKTRKKEFNQSKNLVYAAYLLVTSLSLAAWANYYKGNVAGFSIASLLVLLAFGYMWVHYLTGFLKANYQEDLNTRLSFRISQLFVLAAIVAHPIIISANLKAKGYGLPPDSYEFYFGASKKLFILLGGISLSAFLLFELKTFLKRYPKVWSNVLRLNDLAMLFIIVHGFKLGLTISSTWFKHIWLLYGISLLYFYYDSYINKKKLKRFSELFIISLVIIMMFFITLATDLGKSSIGSIDSNSSSSNSQQNSGSNNTTDTKNINLNELNAANGLNGNKCYVAVSGTVYDASDSSEWSKGEHTPSRGQAKCGQDLTEIIKLSPHGDVVLNQLPIIGKLAAL